MANIGIYCCCEVCKDTLPITISGLDASACAACFTGFGGFAYDNVVISIDGSYTLTHGGSGFYSVSGQGTLDYDRGVDCASVAARPQKTLNISVSIICPTIFDPTPSDEGRILQVNIGNLAAEDTDIFQYNSTTVPGTPLYVGDTIPNQITNCGAVPSTVVTSLSDSTGSVVIG